VSEVWRLAAENPFSARHIRPGAMTYLFPLGEDCDTLLARLAQNGWTGQILGPHGSGKSSLLASLLAAVASRGITVCHVELHDGQRALAGGWRFLSGLPRRTLLVIDGYEQLAWWWRRLLPWYCRRRGLGLLATAHQSVGLPDLFQTEINAVLAERIVRLLLRENTLPLDPDELADGLARHQGNLREVLFDLYDAYEQWRRNRPGTPNV
jgi:hypothetical protein